MKNVFGVGLRIRNNCVGSIKGGNFGTLKENEILEPLYFGMLYRLTETFLFEPFNRNLKFVSGHFTSQSRCIKEKEH